MKTPKLTIYTKENQNGKFVSQVVVISKSNVMTPSVSKKNSFTGSNSNLNASAAASGSLCQTTPLSKVKRKQIFENSASSHKLSSTAHSLKQVRQSTANENRSSCFRTSPLKGKRTISREKIEKKIGNIIKLKNVISKLESKPSELEVQKKEIEDFFSNKVNDLQEAGNVYIKERNMYRDQEEKLKDQFSILKQKHDELLQKLVAKQNYISDMNTYLEEQQQKEKEKKEFDNQIIEKQFKSMLLSIKNGESKFSSSFLIKQNSQNIGVILSKKEIETISLLLRVIFSELKTKMDHLLYNSFDNDLNPTIDRIATKIQIAIEQNSYDELDIQSLKIYFENIFNSTSMGDKKITIFTVGNLKQLFLYHLGEVKAFYDEEAFEENIRKYFEKDEVKKEYLFNALIDKDTLNNGIVSFKELTDILNELEINLPEDDFECMIYLMKKRNEFNKYKFGLFDLRYDNLINLIKGKKYKDEIIDDYEERIEEYLIKNNISFKEFIYPLGPFAIQRGDEFNVEVKHFQFLLRKEKIIREYQRISDDEFSEIYLTKLADSFSMKGLCKPNRFFEFEYEFASSSHSSELEKNNKGNNEILTGVAIDFVSELFMSK